MLLQGLSNVGKHIGFLKCGHLSNEFNEGATTLCNKMQFFCTEGPNGLLKTKANLDMLLC